MRFLFIKGKNIFLTGILLKLVCVGSILFLGTNQLQAQTQPVSKQIHEQGQVWLGFFNQTRLSEKFSLWVDLHARRTDLFDRWSTTIVRPGITYHLPHHINFTAGYAYVSHYPL
jgi:hypothetical protein